MKANFSFPENNNIQSSFVLPENSITATFKIETVPDISNLATKAELQDVASHIPTDTSELTNGAEFITNETNKLQNYYTSDEVNNLMITKQDVFGIGGGLSFEKDSLLIDEEWLISFVARSFNLRPVN